jgi:hypothetical protein
MTRKWLLICGILSSLVYVAADVLGGIWLEGYSHMSQAVSELSAIGSASRPIVVPLLMAHSVLVIAFGFGIRSSADRKRALLVAGSLMIALGLLDLTAYFWPMNPRGTERTLTDTIHIIGTAVTVLVIVLAIAFSGRAFGRPFRAYAVATILAMLVFGGLTAILAPGVESGQPTPWMGLMERINIYSYLLWQVVLAAALLRARASAAPALIARTAA